MGTGGKYHFQKEKATEWAKSFSLLSSSHSFQCHEYLWLWEVQHCLATVNEHEDDKMTVRKAGKCVLHSAYWSYNRSAPIHWPPDAKSWLLGKIDGKRIRGQQRIRWLRSITDSMDMSLSKHWEISEGWESLVCCCWWGHRVRLDLVTEQQQDANLILTPSWPVVNWDKWILVYLCYYLSFQYLKLNASLIQTIRKMYFPKWQEVQKQFRVG